MAKSSGTARKSSGRATEAKKSATAKGRSSAKPAKAKASKPAPKAAAKPAAKAAKTTKKAAPTPKPAPKKAPAKPTTAAAPVAEAPVKSGPTLAPAARDGERGAKPARKGITVVNPKAAANKKAKDKAGAAMLNHPGPMLLSPGSPIRRPLIPSGPNAPARDSGFGAGAQANKPKKSPFNKKQLDRFREILLRKRAELAGDVSQMEIEALQGNSGSLSNLPQHMAEQGSDTYGQTLALDLAAADRRLIREIDDALRRIDEGTFGICEITGKPIRVERLEELPWARYSIEAAREVERRAGSAL